jgi:hypothetical protein
MVECPLDILGKSGMRGLLFTLRRSLAGPLALLVLAALSHCSWQESRELAQHAAAAALHRAGLPSPVQAPAHDCDRESGCICKGAKLVQAVDVQGFAGQPSGEMPPILASELTVNWHQLPDSSPLTEAASPPHPVSGRQLRALYASLVI